MHRTEKDRRSRSKIVTVLLAVLAMVGTMFLVAGPASAGTPPTKLVPATGTATAGVATTLTIKENGTAAGKKLTCNEPGPSDCFGQLLPTIDFHLTYQNGGAKFKIFVAANTPVGDYSLDMKAKNSAGVANHLTYTLHVVAAPTVTVTPDPAVFHAGSTSTEQVAIKSNEVGSKSEVTCADCAAVLPTGLAFTSLGYGAQGTAFISGMAAAGTGGAYTVHLAVDAKNGATLSYPLLVTVLQTPAFDQNSATLLAGTKAPLPITVSTTGYPGVTSITETTGTGQTGLPPGVNFTDNGNGTAKFNGKPVAGDSGLYTVTLTANNGVNAPVSETFTFTVNQTPAITGPTSITETVGAAGGTYNYSATGYPAPTTALQSGALPNGMYFQPSGSGGYIYGSPIVGTGGAYTIVLRASNSVGYDDITVHILVNEAPEFTSLASANFTTGQANTFTVTTKNGYPPPAVLSINAGCLPAGLTFVDNGDGTATISGNPALNTAGPYTCTITAANGDSSASNTQTFQLMIRPPAVSLPATEVQFANGSLGGVGMSVRHGATLTLNGSGFAPYAPVSIGIYDSTGNHLYSLGTTYADASGNFSGFVTAPIPSDSYYRGQPSDIVATGVTAPSGSPQTLRTSTVVN